jgi:uncharacterized protein
VRVFLDTNVLASAFGTRGLCADVFRIVLAEHELVCSEAVLTELKSVLLRKFRVPAATAKEIDAFIRGYHVEPNPREIPDLPLDADDLIIIAAAIAGKADVFVTGDAAIRELRVKSRTIRICSPREFWEVSQKIG